MRITTTHKFKAKLETYLEFVREKMKRLRTLVIETAEGIEILLTIDSVLMSNYQKFALATVDIEFERSKGTMGDK